MDKYFYNEASAAKLGWAPAWFNAATFDDFLINQIKKWQRKNKLKADGLCGPSTYRRIWTERESTISEQHPSRMCFTAMNKNIVHNGNFYPIDWPQVVLWDEPKGLKCNPGTYTSWAGKEDRNPSFFVNHWDVCLSAESCAKVLDKRGISVHFCIDNDGTIFQLLDTQHRAWQAGGSMWNTKSIGVEISNAYYTKYQDWYIRNDFGPRPVVNDVKCHGQKLGEHLDFYPIQLEALKALWVAIHGATGIPLECPTDSNGELVTGVDKQCVRGEFKGFVNHYNLTRNKIDCAGLDLVGLLKEAK
jgi:hypothetical protein